jgi:hypothetical protein
MRLSSRALFCVGKYNSGNLAEKCSMIGIIFFFSLTLWLAMLSSVKWRKREIVLNLSLGIVSRKMGVSMHLFWLQYDWILGFRTWNIIIINEKYAIISSTVVSNHLSSSLTFFLVGSSTAWMRMGSFHRIFSEKRIHILREYCHFRRGLDSDSSLEKSLSSELLSKTLCTSFSKTSPPPPRTFVDAMMATSISKI